MPQKKLTTKINSCNIFMKLRKKARYYKTKENINIKSTEVPVKKSNNTIPSDLESHALHNINYEIKCAVCLETIPHNKTESYISFIEHPFFSGQKICPKHEFTTKKCVGCHKLEPINERFCDLFSGEINDKEGAQFMCSICRRTAVINNDEIDLVWNEVLDFLEVMCRIPISNEMRNISVISADPSLLNQLIDNSNDHCEFNYSSYDKLHCYGVCLSREKSDLDSSCNNIIGILCLRGLPKELTASTLVHEAIHAWLKLNPLYNLLGSLPPIVEEGCCQLASYLYLEYKILCLKSSYRESQDIIIHNEIELCQYFQYCIKDNSSPIYKEGFRLAWKVFCSLQAQCKLTLEDLLQHVLIHNEFPTVST